jgi:hypothetical protein
VPALPSSVLEPLWVQVAALVPVRQDTHPLGCHRPRIPDRIVFDKLIQIPVFGCGYRRIADAICSATTLRRRRDEWITLGLAEEVRLAVLAAYGCMLSLDLEHLGGRRLHHQGVLRRQTAGHRPVERRKQGAEALGRRRGAWDPAGGGAGPSQPPRRWAVGRHLGRHRRGWPAAAAARGAPGRRLRLAVVPAGLERAGHGRRDRHSGQAPPVQASVAGRWGAPMRGATSTASCAGAPNAAGWWWWWSSGLR